MKCRELRKRRIKCEAPSNYSIKEGALINFRVVTTERFLKITFILFVMLEQYWKIGHAYYGEFNDTLMGRILSIVQYSLLPPCHKAGAQVGDKILIGSFRGADKVAFEAFYDAHGVNGNIEGRVETLEQLFESNSGEAFGSIAKNPQLRFKLLENKCRDYVWKSLD
jgi:hypothetical protein